MLNRLLLKKHRPLSLASRLTLFISITMITAFLIFSWLMIQSVEKHFEEQDIDDLQQLKTFLTHILSNQAESEKKRIDQVISAASNYSNTFIYLQSQQGVLIQSTDGPDFNAIINQGKIDPEHITIWDENSVKKQARNSHQAGGYRIALIPIKNNIENVNYKLIIALSIDFHLHYIHDLTKNLMLAALITCLIMIFIVHFAVYQGHAPLRTVSKKIQSITSENLHIRLIQDTIPIELEQLVISFNTMIGQIEDVFKRQSHFSADIAHEIRTPITNLVTQTQIALNHARSVEEYQEVLYSNLEEYERMAKMVSDMLFLAQADNNLLIPERAIIDLHSEINKVFEYFEAWAEEKNVTLQLVDNVTPIQGDPLMLRRVINNLLSNAIRYTPEGKTVTVSLCQTPTGIQLIVENPGTQIPPEHLSRLFDRFYRVDRSRQRKGDGSGIGLAIVKSIVETHQGNISVSSDPFLTKFTLYLPKLQKR